MRPLLASCCLILAAACGGRGAAEPVPPAPGGDSSPAEPVDRCPLLSCAGTDSDRGGCPDPFLEFQAGSAELKPLTMGLVEELAVEIKATARLRGVRLDGHAGSGETEELARERAQTVRGYLIDNGVRPELLEIAARVDPAEDATYVTFEVLDCGDPAAAADDEAGSAGAVDLILQ